MFPDWVPLTWVESGNYLIMYEFPRLHVGNGFEDGWFSVFQFVLPYSVPFNAEQLA